MSFVVEIAGGTIRFLKYITGLWLVQGCRRHFEMHGIRYSYDHLSEAAAAAEPFRTPVDTGYAPSMSAGQMPDKLAQFARRTNQPEPADIGQMVRCCLVSLALTHRHTLEQLERVLDRTFDALHIVGGGGQNHLLNEMTAGGHCCVSSVLPRPSVAPGVMAILPQCAPGPLARTTDSARNPSFSLVRVPMYIGILAPTPEI